MRWKAMECQNAWEDAINVWRACDEHNSEVSFTKSVAHFLHMAPGSKCDDTGAETLCNTAQCIPHNTDTTEDKDRTGACASEVWNSIAVLHAIIKNYHYALVDSGDELRSTRETFISTFAPKPKDMSAVFGLLLTLIPHSPQYSSRRFLRGWSSLPSFKAPADGKGGVLESAVSNMVSAGASVAKDALASAEDHRSEKSFNAIYNILIGSWKEQSDLFMKKVFSGNAESIKLLSSLFSNGQMLEGGFDVRRRNDDDHTENWNRQKNIQRAFYAAAIPAVWTANRPAPVVIDFGPSCEIDARKYFNVPPSNYNRGWVCSDGHSYILADVRDGPQNMCGPSYPGDGGGCNPTPKYTFTVLDAIHEIQKSDNEWGGVTVDDIVLGAVNTWKKNGKKNIMDPEKRKPDVADYQAIKLDIRKAGLVRIPVCSAEEATANLNKGREVYGDSPNYPCNA